MKSRRGHPFAVGDCDELANLGKERDHREIPVGQVIPWAEGDMPPGESLDLNEYPSVLEGLKKCRSFRADLHHKLTIILRAHGGYGGRSGAITRVSEFLKVNNRRRVRRWLMWDSVPTRTRIFERIDNAYSDALELLAADKVRRDRHNKNCQRHRKKKKALRLALIEDSPATQNLCEQNSNAP